LPHGVLEKFFDPVPENSDSFEVCLAARQLVSFKKLNLVEDWPFSGFFDVILCRNVVIYFENTTQEKLWVQFAKHMKPNSNLYLGHSERLSPSALKNFRSVGDTRYVRAHNLLNSGRELLGASRENGVAYEP
jgi:chemotaxis protein methyltransferase CheR